jgi:hypothetical protein
VNGTSTVTLNTNGNANGLQLAAGNTLNIDGASLSLASGTSLNYGILFNTGGTITNSGRLTNSAKIIVQGDAFLGGSDAVLINNSGAYITNNGAIDVDLDGARLFNSGTFINNSVVSLVIYIIFDDTAGTYFVNSGKISLEAGFFKNEGTFNNSGTTGITSIGDPSTFSNSGTFNNSGTLTMDFSAPSRAPFPTPVR